VTRRSYLTIVSGIPRSGTSMMMRMLDEGGITVLTDNLRAPDEDNPKGYYEFGPVKRTKKDASWVKGARGKAVKMVHLLLLDLPSEYQYRVIFMHRDLREIVESQNIMLARLGKKTDDMPADRLIEIYRSQIQKVLQYVREHPGDFQLLELDYNKILKDARPHLEQASEFLDGLDIEKMLAVVDTSLYRTRTVN